MIDKFEILSLSKSLNLLPTTIEKDYVLGWVLMGINCHPKTKNHWIFKGGTCLKKCYFEHYRFSEDLDFTLLEPEHISENLLKEIFYDVSQWIYEESEIEIPNKLISIDIHRNNRGQVMAECKLTYHASLKQKTNFPRIKLDLTASEKLVLVPEERPIFHSYTDKPSNAPLATCYCYEEIFAEKLRALIERMRPRDLYDVVHLFQKRDKISKTSFLETLRKKCDSKQIPLPTLESIEAHTYKQSLPLQWKDMLAHQVARLESYDTFWSHLPAVFDWIYSTDIKT
jgi:predicted nucleotidyltransferase component of viral defense system